MTSKSRTELFFVYGTLKTGQPNNAMLATDAGAVSLGTAVTADTFYLCGDKLPYMIPARCFRRLTGLGAKAGRLDCKLVEGELWEISGDMGQFWQMMDQFESNGENYHRSKIHILDEEEGIVTAWAYLHLNSETAEKAGVGPAQQTSEHCYRW